MLKELKYLDVVVPLSVKGVFQYSIQKNVDIVVGQRVIVQFGLKKLYTAIVVNISDKKNQDFKIKEIQSIVDEQPIISQLGVDLWKWISDYYMCTLGEVMNTALPTSLKLASESKLIINNNFDKNISTLNDQEEEVIQAIQGLNVITIRDLNRRLSSNFSFSIINALIKKGVLLVYEQINEKYKKRVLCTVLIDEQVDTNSFKLTKKQDDLFRLLLKIDQKNGSLVLSDLMKQTSFSRSVFNTLQKKSAIQIIEKEYSRFKQVDKKLLPINKLSKAQELSFVQVNNIFAKKDICLLHGVTSSGKTEIYIKLIEQEIKKGKQVLYLLPEIALTIQIIKRLKNHFGNLVGVSHSNLNNSERVEVWKSVQAGAKNKFSIILGARSSVFLPFNNLGLIVIDEEHDSSYKQQQPAPRYHARDSAIYLASLHNAKVLLGSATPSIETYYNAKNKKYGFVELLTRFSDIKLPKINAIDVKKGYLKKDMDGFFSNRLIDEIKSHLDNNKQIILFQNRRGYSKVLSCDACGDAISCKFCSVSLTYHKLNNNLRCHYCGYIESIPDSCNTCNNTSLSRKGFGTEQITEALREIFPGKVVKRMDFDTTRKKNAYQEIIFEFQQSKIDILVGTQMIAKGFDFDNVSLVGILDSDSMLNFPDFRSHERAFQLMSQVSGRAGRKGSQGVVFLQTFNPDHEIIKHVKSHSFSNFYKLQIQERKMFNYPPFSRLLLIRFKHTDHLILDNVAGKFAKMMRESFNNRVLGPEYPVISKVRNYYVKNILLKVEVTRSFLKAKKIVLYILDHMKENKMLDRCIAQIDIDPN